MEQTGLRSGVFMSVTSGDVGGVPTSTSNHEKPHSTLTQTSMSHSLVSYPTPYENEMFLNQVFTSSNDNYSTANNYHSQASKTTHGGDMSVIYDTSNSSDSNDHFNIDSEDVDTSRSTTPAATLPWTTKSRQSSHPAGYGCTTGHMNDCNSGYNNNNNNRHISGITRKYGQQNENDVIVSSQTFHHLPRNVDKKRGASKSAATSPKKAPKKIIGKTPSIPKTVNRNSNSNSNNTDSKKDKDKDKNNTSPSKRKLRMKKLREIMKKKNKTKHKNNSSKNTKRHKNKNRSKTKNKNRNKNKNKNKNTNHSTHDVFTSQLWKDYSQQQQQHQSVNSLHIGTGSQMSTKSTPLQGSTTPSIGALFESDSVNISMRIFNGNGLLNWKENLPKTLVKYANVFDIVNKFWRNEIDLLSRTEFKDITMMQYCWIIVNYPKCKDILKHISDHQSHLSPKHRKKEKYLSHSATKAVMDCSPLQNFYELIGYEKHTFHCDFF